MAETRLPYEGKAHPESVVYVADYTAVEGIPPSHNTMVQALVARGLSRTRARHDWQVLVKNHQAEETMESQAYPMTEATAPGEPVAVAVAAQVQALRAEVEALKRDAASARKRERALEGAVQQLRELVEVLHPERQREALEARVALLEAQQQQMRALVEEFCELLRRYTPYKVANLVLEFSTSIPRTQLRPGDGDGFLGAPLHVVPASQSPIPQKQGDRRGTSSLPTAPDAGGSHRI